MSAAQRITLTLHTPDVDGVRRTSWTLSDRGVDQVTSVNALRNRADALRQIERVLNGSVRMIRETETSRPKPVSLWRLNGDRIPIFLEQW